MALTDVTECSVILNHFRDPWLNAMCFELIVGGQVVLTEIDNRKGLDRIYAELEPTAVPVIQKLVCEARATGSATLAS